VATSGSICSMRIGRSRVDSLYRAAAADRTRELRVVRAEGLIGFKLQPDQRSKAHQDLETSALLRANRDTLDRQELRSTFAFSTVNRFSMNCSASMDEAPIARRRVAARRRCRKIPIRHWMN